MKEEKKKKEFMEKQLLLKMADVLEEEHFISSIEKARVLQRIREKEPL